MSPCEMCVIYNPTSGRGWTARHLAELRHSWAERAAFWPTSAPGQAEELALRAALDGFATIAAAGGDGTVHEVANGLLRAERPEVVLAVIPTGSANDYAAQLGLDTPWWRDDDPSIRPHVVDVGVVRAAGRRRYFVSYVGLGLLGTIAQESRRIPWLRGVALYGLAALRTVFRRYERTSMTIVIDGEERKTPTLALSVDLCRREGHFVFAPEAVLDDGLFDYIHAGPLRRRDLVPLLPRLLMGRGLPRHYPNLWQGRCRRVRLHSQAPLVVHMDGEMFCVRAEGIRDLEIDLAPRALRVLGRSK
ncbi:MAG: diacylglycerol/lipid kinase family protein [Gemmataceae bacterium]